MPDSSKTEAERVMQREFRKVVALLACATLAGLVLIAAYVFHGQPDRIELGRRQLWLGYERISLGADHIGPFAITGAWRVRVDDPRFGGISALAIDRSAFLALSDSGVVARFPKPGTDHPSVLLDELPGGPGNRGFKYNRDSEAIAADPKGRGWWVAFENRNALWLFDQGFDRVLERQAIDAPEFARNRGVEAMVADRGRLLLFAERGGRALSVDGLSKNVRGVSGWISDAVQLGDGGLLIANRTPTPLGLSNRLALLRPDRNGYVQQAAWRIPVDRLANVEALALETQPDGALRLWMMTDNNLQQRRPTLLIALELRPRPAR